MWVRLSSASPSSSGFVPFGFRVLGRQVGLSGSPPQPAGWLPQTAARLSLQGLHLVSAIVVADLEPLLGVQARPPSSGFAASQNACMLVNPTALRMSGSSFPRLLMMHFGGSHSRARYVSGARSTRATMSQRPSSASYGSPPPPHGAPLPRSLGLPRVRVFAASLLCACASRLASPCSFTWFFQPQHLPLRSCKCPCVFGSELLQLGFPARPSAGQPASGVVEISCISVAT